MSQVGAALAGKHGLRHLAGFCRSMGHQAAGALPGATAAAAMGADIVVHHPVLPIGQHLAEMLGVSAVVAEPLPALVPTREFLSAAWPCRAPGMLNRPPYHAARRLAGTRCRRDIDCWRRDVLALPPQPGRHDPLLSRDGAGDALRGPVRGSAARDTGRRGDQARAAGPSGRSRLRAVRLGRIAPDRRPGRAGARAAAGTKLLLDHTRQARLGADRADIASRAVAEILRYEPPVQLFVRVAVEPAEIAGAGIAAGSMVIGLVAAANRDPARFTEPEVFDVTRDQVASLSFGARPHYCLAPSWRACRARSCSRGCCAGFPACSRLASRSTGRRARPCAAWSSCRCM